MAEFDQVGDNLSGKNLEYFEAPSAEGIKRQLEQIRLPYQIINIYASGTKHYAWVNCSRKIKKVTKSEKGLKND